MCTPSTHVYCTLLLLLTHCISSAVCSLLQLLCCSPREEGINCECAFLRRENMMCLHIPSHPPPPPPFSPHPMTLTLLNTLSVCYKSAQNFPIFAELFWRISLSLLHLRSTFSILSRFDYCTCIGVLHMRRWTVLVFLLMSHLTWLRQRLTNLKLIGWSRNLCVIGWSRNICMFPEIKAAPLNFIKFQYSHVPFYTSWKHQ